MNDALTLRTEHLLLRPWRKDDYGSFASMNADPEVMRYLPAALSREESNALADRLALELEQRGWGIWALERLDNGEFIGFAGLNPFTDLPFADGTEIAWRLKRSAWGRGYASEAARQALAIAFERLKLTEVVSFTATSNLRSIAVMKRIGMENSGATFQHPRVTEGSPLREHVLYRIDRERWLVTRVSD